MTLLRSSIVCRCQDWDIFICSFHDSRTWLVGQKSQLGSTEDHNRSDLKIKGVRAQELTTGYTTYAVEKWFQTYMSGKGWTAPESVEGTLSISGPPAHGNNCFNCCLHYQLRGLITLTKGCATGYRPTMNDLMKGEKVNFLSIIPLNQIINMIIIEPQWCYISHKLQWTATASHLYHLPV